ncbi:helix-turn-helix domain-containing protein, partial [Lactobacillus sp. ESL0228]
MSKYLLKTKLEAVDLYQRGFSTKEIQEKLHITSRRSIDGWINNYQQYGN